VLISSQRFSLARCSPSAWGRTAVTTGCADDAGECSARRHRFGTKSSVAEAVLLSPGHIDALDFPDESPEPCLVPAHGHLSTDRGRRSELPSVGDSWRASSVCQLVCEVPDVPLSDVAGCFQDDAPVRRASRLRTTPGGAPCVHFVTALTDRDRSRQNFPSALRAPLTLRRFPGAFSFQQQSTREESP
jgi:hypothetical protein